MLDVRQADLTGPPCAMASDTKINVNVYISDALKDMFGCTLGPTEVSDAIVPVAPASDLVDWQALCIRRDGHRPVSFIGLQLLDRRCVDDGMIGQTEQSLTFYLAEDGTIYAGLAFEPSDTCAAWPAYRCQAIHGLGDLAHFLREWRPELCFEKAHQTEKMPSLNLLAGPLAARAAFNSMAAECLTLAVLQG